MKNLGRLSWKKLANILSELLLYDLQTHSQQFELHDPGHIQHSLKQRELRKPYREYQRFLQDISSYHQVDFESVRLVNNALAERKIPRKELKDWSIDEILTTSDQILSVEFKKYFICIKFSSLSSLRDKFQFLDKVFKTTTIKWEFKDFLDVKSYFSPNEHASFIKCGAQQIVWNLDRIIAIVEAQPKNEYFDAGFINEISKNIKWDFESILRVLPYIHSDHQYQFLKNFSNKRWPSEDILTAIKELKKPREKLQFIKDVSNDIEADFVIVEWDFPTIVSATKILYGEGDYVLAEEFLTFIGREKDVVWNTEKIADIAIYIAPSRLNEFINKRIKLDSLEKPPRTSKLPNELLIKPITKPGILEKPPSSNIKHTKSEFFFPLNKPIKPGISKKLYRQRNVIWDFENIFRVLPCIHPDHRYEFLKNSLKNKKWDSEKAGKAVAQLKSSEKLQFIKDIYKEIEWDFSIIVSIAKILYSKDHDLAEGFLAFIEKEQNILWEPKKIAAVANYIQPQRLSDFIEKRVKKEVIWDFDSLETVANRKYKTAAEKVKFLSEEYPKNQPWEFGHVLRVIKLFDYSSVKSQFLFIKFVYSKGNFLSSLQNVFDIVKELEKDTRLPFLELISFEIIRILKEKSIDNKKVKSNDQLIEWGLTAIMRELPEKDRTHFEKMLSKDNCLETIFQDIQADLDKKAVDKKNKEEELKTRPKEVVKLEYFPKELLSKLNFPNGSVCESLMLSPKNKKEMEEFCKLFLRNHSGILGVVEYWMRAREENVTQTLTEINKIFSEQNETAEKKLARINQRLEDRNTPTYDLFGIAKYLAKTIIYDSRSPQDEALYKDMKKIIDNFYASNASVGELEKIKDSKDDIVNKNRLLKNFISKTLMKIGTGGHDGKNYLALSRCIDLLDFSYKTMTKEQKIDLETILKSIISKLEIPQNFVTQDDKAQSEALHQKVKEKQNLLSKNIWCKTSGSLGVEMEDLGNSDDQKVNKITKL